MSDQLSFGFEPATNDFSEAVELFQTNKRLLFVKLRELALDLLKRQESITADDLRFTGLDADRRIIGAVLGSLLRDELIVKLGYTKTSVKTSHGRPVFRYALKGQD